MLARNECMTFGTTEEMITSSTSPGAKPLSLRNCVIIRPYSSEVWFAFVVMRYVPAILPSWMNPSTTLVLPMSTAIKSMPNSFTIPENPVRRPRRHAVRQVP